MLTLKHFSGLTPRVPAENLQPNYAEVAEDVDLRHGTLTSWRYPKAVFAAPEDSKTIYQFSCCWLHWDKCVEVAPWVVGCQRLYVTGDREYPYVMDMGDECSSVITRVGVPAPATAPSARALPATQPNNNYIPNSTQREARAYLYTYVNRLGEEGPPSYASNQVDTDDGSPVTLSNFSVPPAEYGVTHVNIYRLVTGFREPLDTISGGVPQGSDYFLVATIPVGQATYIDGGLNIDRVGEPLATMEVMEPPADLRGIIQIANTNLLAGFSGNTLCISLNNQPWNWPEAHRYELDDNIVAIESYNGRIYVVTDGHPYTVTLNQGGDPRACHEVRRHNTPMPAIVCCSDRGVLATPLGVLFVSDKGLVQMGDAEPTVITSSWFASDDWRQLQPHTIRLGWYDGVIFFASEEKTYMLQLDDSSFGDGRYHRLTSLSLKPRAMHSGRNGELFFLMDGLISQWNASNQLMPYTWRSAKINSRQYSYYGALRLWAMGAVSISIFAEGQTIFDQITIVPNRAQRLPRYGHHLYHQVEMSGTQAVVALEMAKDRWELSTL